MNKYIKLIVFILIIGVKMETEAQTQAGSAEAALLEAGNARTLILKQQKSSDNETDNEIGLSFEAKNDNYLWNVFTDTADNGLHFRTNKGAQDSKEWSKTNIFSIHRDMFILNRKVGIGTTNPEAALDVTPSIEVGESASALRLRAGNKDSDGSDTNSQLLFSSAEESGSLTHAIKSRHNSEQPGGNSLDFYLWDKTVDDPGTVGSQHVMSLNGGKVGIGTKDPETELHVKGDFLTEGSLWVEKKNDKDELVKLKMSLTTNGDGWMGTSSKHNLWLSAGNKELIKLDTLGGVTVIGSENKPTKVVIRNYGEGLEIAEDLASKFNLFTTNGIWSEDFAISDKSVLQPDYVFEESYALSSLDFLEDYVKTNKHLPDVPGASQIEKDGYLSLSKQSTGILKNLEEQVLHNIRQEKKITAQEKEIKTQAAQIRVQQEMINTLISRIEKMEERLNR